MADLEKIVQQGESVKDRKMSLFGLRVSGASIIGLFALISTILGSLYGGFLLYQKVESLAALDLGEISAAMEKTSSDLERIGENVNAVKIELKKDMSDIRSNFYSLEARIDTKLTSADSKLTNFDQKIDMKLTSYDDKLFRFDDRVNKFKTDLEEKIQIALDNPLNY
tara:strand:- start:3687 stop:4187 length:501 start_codon:yes stop_codon:yes gene_type:complete